VLYCAVVVGWFERGDDGLEGVGGQMGGGTLFSLLIHRKALKVDIPARPKLWLNGAGHVDGALEPQVGDAVLEDLEVDGDDAGHLDGAAEGDLAVAL
jgi:hypothetical protein